MNRVDADQIRAEMIKIGALRQDQECQTKYDADPGASSSRETIYAWKVGHSRGGDVGDDGYTDLYWDKKRIYHKDNAYPNEVEVDGKTYKKGKKRDTGEGADYHEITQCKPKDEKPDPGPDPEGPGPGDPCHGVDCPPCHECRDGSCVNLCPEGQICKDGQCVEQPVNPPPSFDPPAQVTCPEGQTAIWDNGEQVCCNDCDDQNAIPTIGCKCICKDGYILDPDTGKCREECHPSPPHGNDGDCDDDPCKEVSCTPPLVCTDGKCECPEGTKLEGGLCIPDDPCFGILCGPHASCKKGTCECDEGYTADARGNCQPDLDPECSREADCCPSNATIMLGAGDSLGGGGSFALNRSCDKTITFWVDPSSDTDEEECESCSCSYELSQLMETVLELKEELEMLQENAKKCEERHECSGFKPVVDPCKDHVASGKECENDSDCPECEKCVSSGRTHAIIGDIEAEMIKIGAITPFDRPCFDAARKGDGYNWGKTDITKLVSKSDREETLTWKQYPTGWTACKGGEIQVPAKVFNCPLDQSDDGGNCARDDNQKFVLYFKDNNDDWIEYDAHEKLATVPVPPWMEIGRTYQGFVTLLCKDQKNEKYDDKDDKCRGSGCLEGQGFFNLTVTDCGDVGPIEPTPKGTCQKR